MPLQLRLVRQNAVQTAVQARIVDFAFPDLQQIVQRRARIPTLLDGQSLPGAHRRLIASTAATRDHGTSACSPSMVRSKKQSSSRRFHSSSPKKHPPNCRVLSSRTLFSSTRATCGSSAGGATCEGKSFSCCASPCSLKTSTVLSQRDCAELFSSPR